MKYIDTGHKEIQMLSRKDFKNIAVPEERWKKGISHCDESVEIFEAIAFLDYEFNSNMFDWRSGGDGDNGESLMFLLDMYFEHRDRTRKGQHTDHQSDIRT